MGDERPERVTRENIHLLAAKPEGFFCDMNKGGWMQQHAWEIRGRALTRTARAETRNASVLIRWTVDGAMCRDFDNAIAVLNGEAEPISPLEPEPAIAMPPPEPPAFTARELAEACAGEAKMRQRVYQRWVDEKRRGWTQARLDRGVALMEAAALHFRRWADAEEAAEAPRLPL